MADFQWLSLVEGRAAIRLCNSYNRLPAIIELAYRMGDWEWLALLGEEWQSCDNIAQCHNALWDTPFADLVESPLIWRAAMMTEVERRTVAAWPETVTIFRGCYLHNKRGLSWTLSRETAERFPMQHRYQSEGQPLLIRATVKRDQILALKLERDESEVIAWWPKVQAISFIRSAEA